MAKEPLFIGLTGTNASGKGTVAEFLRCKGFSYHSLSDVLREELKKDKIEITRENLIARGNSLRSKFGSSILAKRTVLKLKNSNSVIDSIRNTKEIEELKRLKNFILISVDASIEIRFKRAVERGRLENAASLREFEAIEKRELSENAAEQQLDKCMKMADIKIINDSTKEELNKKIGKILEKYKTK